MKTYIIPRANTDVYPASIQSPSYDRLIEFPEGHKIAVILGHHYIKDLSQNPCYYTYKDEQEAFAAIEKYWKNYALEAIDDEGYLRSDIINYDPAGRRFEEAR